jgi:histidinol dehydrogenase|tara:strand:- start:2867 stop:3940 length:1074 start_codon:yes stop_codon:yes gene_type:complete
MKKVTKIIKNVKRKGDKAILKYNIKFDKNKNKKFEITREQIKEAYRQTDKETIKAIKYAIKNISDFANAQLKQFKDFELKRDYGVIGQKMIPIENVGCYVPGGNFPLLSSALMSVIPAKIAGVKNIVVCSPKIKPEVIVAADLAGATRIFNIGGIQAIAALAYGTKQIPKVDKIVGPGNKYVTEAKKQVFGDVGIDFIAGPSEILIITDETANKEFIKADLKAQKEHDKDAKIWVLKTNDAQIEQTIKKANEIAPEHLELFVKNPKKYINKLRNYGSLFIGNSSGVVFGDYCSGTNHILPTNKASRYTGGLSVKDFIKLQTYQKIKPNKKLIKSTMKLAKIEGLEKHRTSAELRLKS